MQDRVVGYLPGCIHDDYYGKTFEALSVMVAIMMGGGERRHNISETTFEMKGIQLPI